MIPVKTSNVFFPTCSVRPAKERRSWWKKMFSIPMGHSNAWQALQADRFRTFAKYTKGAQHHFTFQTHLKMNEHEDGHLKVINSKGFPFLYGVHGEVLCSFSWWTEHMYYTVYNIKRMGLEHQDKSNLRCIWVYTSCHLKSMNNSGYLDHTACEDQVIISPKYKKNKII